MQVKLERSTSTLVLTGKPLGHGGEAVIHPVPKQHGMPDLVAKVYHRPTANHAAKLAAMIAHPPVDPMADQGHASITWPLDRLVLPNGTATVVGYVMPRIHKALPVVEFFNPKARLKQCPLFHFGYLLRTAHNLAAAVRAIHEAGYVVGDLNESNCLVNNQALVTLVDTDSFQVPDQGRIFRCPVGKPEYTAPEMQGVNFGDRDRAAEHDNFALAVLIFQLLMQGIHPFAGKFTGAGDPASLPERISAGHWPYIGGSKVPYGPNPHAPPLEVLPASVRALMHLCFAEGHMQPKRRPGANAWQDALRDGEKDLVPCKTNQQHLYLRSLSRCPWCELSQRQGRDLFPSQKDVQTGRLGLKRIVARIRKSLPGTTPRPAVMATAGVAVAATLQPAPSRLSLLPAAGSIGPMHAPTPGRSSANMATAILLAALLAAFCATLGAGVMVVWNAPWATQGHKNDWPILGLAVALGSGILFGYCVGWFLQPDDGSGGSSGRASLETIGGQIGAVSGSLGAGWGQIVCSTTPVLLAGNLGKQLGYVGLGLIGGGLVGLVGGLVIGALVGLVVALWRRFH
jgi:DNA-binding helix-hairpin-helix protein with protein kinase domain